MSVESLLTVSILCSNTGWREGSVFSSGLKHLLFVELAEDQRQMPPQLSFCMAVVLMVERQKNFPGSLTCCNSEENFCLEIGSEIRHTFAFF